MDVSGSSLRPRVVFSGKTLCINYPLSKQFNNTYTIYKPQKASFLRAQHKDSDGVETRICGDIIFAL